MERGPMDELLEINGPKKWDEMTSLEQGVTMISAGVVLGLKITVVVAMVVMVGCVALLVTSASA